MTKRPITSILNPKFRYTPSAETDVGARIRRERKRLAAGPAAPAHNVTVLPAKGGRS